jgi:hypothetical protein
MEAEEEETQPGTGKPMVFERADFDKLLNTDSEPGVLVSKREDPGGSDSPVALPAPVAPPPRNPPQAEPEYDVERIQLPPGAAASLPRGIFLSPAKATVLAVATVVALALAFGAGLLVGLLLKPVNVSPPAEQSLLESSGRAAV